MVRSDLIGLWNRLLNEFSLPSLAKHQKIHKNSSSTATPSRIARHTACLGLFLPVSRKNRRLRHVFPSSCSAVPLPCVARDLEDLLGLSASSKTDLAACVSHCVCQVRCRIVRPIFRTKTWIRETSRTKVNLCS